MSAVPDNSGFIVVYFQGHTCGAVIFSVPDMSGFIFRFAVFFFNFNDFFYFFLYICRVNEFITDPEAVDGCLASHQ